MQRPKTHLNFSCQRLDITDTQRIENEQKRLYFCVMLDTELRKLSIFFDTSSMPFLKNPICNIKTMKKYLLLGQTHKGKSALCTETHRTGHFYM